MKADHHVFPSYYNIAKSKKDYYTPEEHIMVTKTRDEINLQAILDKTVERLLQVQIEFNTNFNSSLALVSKWRCDEVLVTVPINRNFKQQ